MKSVATPTQPVVSFFFALFFVVTLTLAGCSANTLSGPDVAPSEEPTAQETLPAAGPNASHNEGEEAGKNQPTNASNGGTHN